MGKNNNGGVYAIKNNENGKIYVGTSSDVYDRISHHVAFLNGHCHNVDQMQSDFDANGGDFSFATLFDGDYADALLLIEKLFMTLLQTRDEEKGYNFNDPSDDFDIEKVRFQSFESRKRRAGKRSDSSREWLIDARSKAGKTQLDMAKSLGISEAYYSYIESGKRKKKMDISLAVELSGLLGIPVQKIVELEGS